MHDGKNTVISSTAWVSAQRYRGFDNDFTAWFLRCLPFVLSPVHLKRTRSCIFCFFSNSYVLFHRILYLLVPVLFSHALQSCFWPLFHPQQRSFAPPKKMTNERTPPDACERAAAGMPWRWQQCSVSTYDCCIPRRPLPDRSQALKVSSPVTSSYGYRD